MTRSPPHPVLAGLRGRCPQCGEGGLFAGFLRFADHCEVCGASFESADVGDGAAVFATLLVGFLIVPPALIMELLFHPPVWAHMLVWLPLALLACLGLLRVLRGVLLASQLGFSAAEARLDE